MPRVGTPSRRNPAIEAALAEWDAYEDRSAWRRSSKGNLWRKWKDVTASVFYRNRRYHWSIAGEDDVEYSQATYGDEEEAMTALGEAIGVGGT